MIAPLHKAPQGHMDGFHSFHLRRFTYEICVCYSKKNLSTLKLVTYESVIVHVLTVCWLNPSIEDRIASISRRNIQYRVCVCVCLRELLPIQLTCWMDWIPGISPTSTEKPICVTHSRQCMHGHEILVRPADYLDWTGNKRSYAFVNRCQCRVAHWISE